MAVGPRDIGVSLTDGLAVECPDPGRIRLDARRLDGVANVVSHAHADHLPRASGPAVCSGLTAALATVRDQRRSLSRVDHEAIRLLPAGHVAGSRAALIECGGRTVLYTGDVCLRDRDYLVGFDPPEADVLIMEATYGRSRYVFPPIEEVRAEFAAWRAERPDRPVVLFGYSLGKAQRVIRLLATEHFDRVFTTDAVLSVNDVIGEHLGVTFDVDPFTDSVELGPGDALVLPSQLARAEWVGRLVDDVEARTAGFSGWAVDDAYRYQRGVDRGFVMSDHADFEELRSIAKRVDPDVLYITHGFTAELASTLTRDGFDATALEAYQATLADF